MDWNPSSTATKGLEWAPHTSQDTALDSSGKAMLAKVLSLAAENIGTVEVYLPSVAVAGNFEVEVVESGDEIPADVLVAEVAPNQDVTFTNMTGVPTNTSGNRYTNVDETTLDTSDYIEGDYGTTKLYEGRFAVGSGNYTGKRILKVGVRWSIENTGTANKSDSNSGLNLGGVVYTATSASASNVGTFTPSDPVLEHYVEWTVNPETLMPWTIADIEALDVNDEFRIDVSGPYSYTLFRIYRIWLEITYADENRVARGNATVSAAGWNAFTVTTPTGGTWAKADATYYTYILRRLGATGSLTWRAIFGSFAPPVNASMYSSVSLDAYGAVSSVGTAQAKRLAPLVLITTSPADAGDSQPYADLVNAAIYSGQTAEQEFSDAAAADYGIVQALIRYSGTPTDDLTVQIRKRSDSSQLGGDLVITTADVDGSTPVGSAAWAALMGQLASVATLTTGTQYYIEFSSATDSGNPWYVAAIETADNANTLTFGGTTDRAAYNGAEADDQELLVTVGTVPNAPTDFAAASTDQTLGAGAGCDVRRIAYIALSWTATALGVEFYYYEIQRTEDAGATWTTIGIVGDEATVTFDDYEGLRGVSAQYRVRSLRLDGAGSDWTAASAGVTPHVDGAEWCLVSNEDPSLNVAYNREPSIRYEIPQADEVEFLAIYGRPYQVALKPTEDRGVTFALPLIVSAVTVPSSPGLPVFAALRALAESDTISYVCVLDPHGNRWLAEVLVHEVVHLEPGRRYLADANVTEISGTFSMPPAG